MEERDTSKFDRAKTEIGENLTAGKQAATETFHDAKDELSQKAGEYVSEAKSALFEKAEGTQRDIGSNLKAFGGALRAASEHLANNDQRSASKFVLQAAGGLESLSTSLKNKPLEEVLSEIRDFGRGNSGALIAGSVLAGLALGRFIKTSPSGSQSAASSTNYPERQSTAPGDHEESPPEAYRGATP